MRTAIGPTWRRRAIPPLVALLLILVLFVGDERAHARSAYLSSYEGDSVFALDAANGRVAVGPIQLGAGTAPLSLAISPDGKTAWVVGEGSGSLTSIDTATNQVIGSPIAVPKGSYGFAITPDGTRAYLALNPDDAVAVVDLQARQVIGSPIDVGEGPSAIAISPDGNRAYVSNNEEGTVSVIDLGTNQVIGSPIPVGGFPYNLAITPDGSTLLIANQDGFANTVDVATHQVGPPIPLGKNPTDLAISPDGARAYASNFEDGTVSIIDVATRSVIGQPVPVGELDEYLAVTPDGARVLVSSYKPPQVAVIDTASNLLVGVPTPVSGGGAIAVVPDQAPTASFRHTRARPSVPVTFNAAGSTDADGSIGVFAWGFGGNSANVPNPIVKHRFARAGKHQVTLTVTDNEGCSTTLIFTGQTAYCNGQPSASQTQNVTVAYPGVRVKCPKRAKRGGCRFKLQAVTKKRKGKSQSALARVRLKAGRSKIVSLKPKKKFRAKLARARKILVRETLMIKGAKRVRYRRLKVVR